MRGDGRVGVQEWARVLSAVRTPAQFGIKRVKNQEAKSNKRRGNMVVKS